MDLNTLTTLIGSLGFPIVACCAMAYYCVQSQKQLREITEVHAREIEHLDERHNEVLEKLTASVREEHESLQALCMKLDELFRRELDK